MKKAEFDFVAAAEESVRRKAYRQAAHFFNEARIRAETPQLARHFAKLMKRNARRAGLKLVKSPDPPSPPEEGAK